MVRPTKTSLNSQCYANRAMRSSRNALLSYICEGMYREFVRNGNWLPYGHAAQLMKAIKPREPWLSRNVINKAFIKFRKDIACKNELLVPESVGIRSTSIIVLQISQISAM